MSEYQYYEFTAIDGPISDEGFEYARASSTRAEVTRYRWRNEYNWGDFGGSVNRLLDYYDAHVYVTNWGSFTFALAFPPATLDTAKLQEYVNQHGENWIEISESKKSGRQKVHWYREEEVPSEWEDGETLLEQLVGVREEIFAGDYRALFIGWLASFNYDDTSDESEGENAVEVPQIPSGMNDLTTPQVDLAEATRVDQDALAAAAEFSASRERNLRPVADILPDLAEVDKNAYLLRVAEGEGARVGRELNRLRIPEHSESHFQSVSHSQLASRANEIYEARVRKEKIEQAIRRRQEQAEERMRVKAIFENADSIWEETDNLVNEGKTKGYDTAATDLKELKSAYSNSSQDLDFQERLQKFRDHWSRRSSMLSGIRGRCSGVRGIRQTHPGPADHPSEEGKVQIRILGWALRRLRIERGAIYRPLFLSFFHFAQAFFEEASFGGVSGQFDGLTISDGGLLRRTCPS